MKKIILKSFLFFLCFILFSCSNIEKTEFEKGKTAFDSEDYKTAIQYFEKVLKENYKNSEAYLLIGRAYLQLAGNNSNNAINYINKSLEYKPDNPEALVYLGDAYQENHCIGFSNTDLFKMMASGKYPVSEEAIAYYQKAININPNYALPYYKIGYTYGFYKNEIDEAINWYKKGIAIDDNFTHVYLHLGQFYNKKNDLVNAIENFTKETERHPNILESYFELAKCLIKKHEYGEATNYLNILAGKNPNYEGLNFYLGIAYQNVDKTKSIEFMKTAARLGDVNAKAWLAQRKINW